MILVNVPLENEQSPGTDSDRTQDKNGGDGSDDGRDEEVRAVSRSSHHLKTRLKETVRALHISDESDESDEEG